MRRFLFLLTLVPLAYLACGGDDDAAIGPKSDSGLEDGSTSDASASDAATDAFDAGPPCAPPSDPSKGALCLYLTPETIEVIPTDPDFDGMGILGVRLYADQNGEEDAGIGDPVILPTQPDGGGPDGGPVLMDITKGLPMVRIDNLPASVYLRAVFFDADFVPRTLRAGWWLAGHDTSKEGLLGSKLAPIVLTAGQGKNVFYDMRALRKLSVTVTRAPATTPVGNGQGQISSLVLDKQTANSEAKGWGVANKPCGDVSGVSAALIDGIVYGAGPYWLTGTLDDFDAGGIVPAGGLISRDSFIDGGIMLPAANKLSYAPNAYKVQHSIQLNQQIPKPNPGPDPVSCP